MLILFGCIAIGAAPLIYFFGKKHGVSVEFARTQGTLSRIDELEDAIVDSVLQRGSLESYARILERIAQGDPLEKNLKRIVKQLYQQIPLSGVAMIVFNSPEKKSFQVVAQGIPEPTLTFISQSKEFANWGPLKSLVDDQIRRIAVNSDPKSPVLTELAAVGYEEVVLHPIRGWSNERLGVLCIFRYIVKSIYKHEVSSSSSAVQLGQIAIIREECERKLISARDEAQASTQSKSQFLANMSHEIRTPMNGVLGMADLLLKTPLNEEQQDLAQTIKECGTSLLCVVNDILDFSKIEAGKLILVPIIFNLPQRLRMIERVLGEQFMKKRISFIADIDPKIPEVVIGDEGRLFQVLINLLGNAVKFTSAEGAVWIVARYDSVINNRVRIAFSVGDSGIGIQEEKLKHIFEAFNQGDLTTTRNFGGTGLGLTISSQLVQLMGGELTVTSRSGIGSLFRFNVEFEIPLNQQISNALEVRNFQSQVSHSLQVLVVEDNLVNQKLLEKILMKAGHTPTIAANGQEALILWNTKKFDAVLMDIQMPIMDGPTCVACIREKENDNGGHVPIIALTAHAMEGDREKYLSQGMDGYISKPIHVEELFKTLYELTAQ